MVSTQTLYINIILKIKKYKKYKKEKKKGNKTKQIA